MLVIPRDVSILRDADSDIVITSVVDKTPLDSSSVLDCAMLEEMIDGAGEEKIAVLLAAPDD